VPFVTIELIGIDRDALIFVGYQREARKEGYLLHLLPVAGELSSNASSAERFFVTSQGHVPVQVENQVYRFEAGGYGDRQYFLHVTAESASLFVPAIEGIERFCVPCLVAAEPMRTQFAVRRAVVSLAYRRFEFDPVYYSTSSWIRACEQALPMRHMHKGTPRRWPYNPMNFKFEEGDRVPVWVDPVYSDHRIILQFESIPKIGTATVSLLTWEPIELKRGMILKRCKTWDQMSEVDGQLCRRSMEANFAVIEEIL
jgi:hypothetical protein